jgi:hypothetical protein
MKIKQSEKIMVAALNGFLIKKDTLIGFFTQLPSGLH